VQLVPDEVAFQGIDNFACEAFERFSSYDPPGRPIVHSHVVPWMVRWCRRQQDNGCRWVHTYHLPYFPEHGGGLLATDHIEINSVLVSEASQAAVRLSVAKWQCDFLKTQYGIETTYLPNGVDLMACDRGDSDRFVHWSRVRRPFVLHVSRNDSVKNPAEFVRLAALRPELCFVVIGQGLDERTMLSDWKTPTPDNLCYLGGRSHSEVQDALAACEALVVTSKREGLPTLVLEAMSHGKSVVVPDEPGCLEAIAQGRYGFIYALGDLTSLSASLVDALSDTSKRNMARKRIESHYDWRIVAKELDAIYKCP
jgi:glycosyltransferase involved in cell wall biosynthesis